MPKPRIDFNDGSARTLQSDWPSPADRFANWQPMTRPVGDSANALADEGLYMFRTSWRYGASFEINGLGMGTVAASSALDIANKLIAHLLNGGTCAVSTEDANGASYSTCGLMPGTTPSLRQVNRRKIEYALSIALINRAGSPAEMICHYSS